MYAKGSRLEREYRDVMTICGYYVVRSAGSHGAVDLVAWNSTDGYLIQVKTRKPSMPEVGAFRKVPCPPNFKRVWVWRVDHGTWKQHEVADVPEQVVNNKKH